MLTIAWDVDDILNNLMEYWLEQKWNKDHPQCNLKFNEIYINSPEALLETSKQEYLASLDEFRLSTAFGDMEPNPKILEWFRQYGGRARHLVLTAVPLECAHASAEWVMRHFGKWIRTFHFVPSYREGVDCPRYDQTKAEFLHWIDKVDVLVEDNEANAIAASKADVRGMLVDRPWNSSELSLEDALKELTSLVS
jgi:hypothetical protein